MKDKPVFRSRMRDESQLAYLAAKAAWQASMVRCGLLCQRDIE